MSSKRTRKIDWQEYSRLCRLIAERAKNEFKPEVVVGIAQGGVIVGATVASLLKLDFFPIKFSRRVNDKVVRKHTKLLVPPTAHLGGKRILLVDDVSRSGETLRSALREIKKYQPSEIYCAVLVREGAYEPNCYATYSLERVVFPWQVEKEDMILSSEEELPRK